MKWIPLNVRSQFSILDSTVSVAALAERARQLGIAALALTDQGNLYGAVEFYKACKAAEVQPILGCTIWVAPTSRLEKKRMIGVPNGFPIVLLAKDNEGYTNLCKLSSIGFLEGFYYQPRIDKEVLAKYAKGLICLSGAMHGPIGHAALQGNEETLRSEIQWYRDLFGGDFYLELQRYPHLDEEMGTESWLIQKAEEYSANQERVNQKFLSLSRELQIPVVATNPIHYLEKQDWQAHEVLLNVQSGRT